MFNTVLSFIRQSKAFFVLIKIIQALEAYGKGHQIIKALIVYKNIVSPFYVAYKNVFAIDPFKENQLVYQELTTTSEVISIQSIAKTPSPKIYQAINKL